MLKLSKFNGSSQKVNSGKTRTIIQIAFCQWVLDQRDKLGWRGKLRVDWVEEEVWINFGNQSGTFEKSIKAKWKKNIWRRGIFKSIHETVSVSITFLDSSNNKKRKHKPLGKGRKNVSIYEDNVIGKRKTQKIRIPIKRKKKIKKRNSVENCRW